MKNNSQSIFAITVRANTKLQTERVQKGAFTENVCLGW